MKYFSCVICENVPTTKYAKELHMKRKHSDTTIQYLPIQINIKVGYTWFACNSWKVKNAPKTSLKTIQKLFMHLLRR